ncbi:MAG: sn-glycerol-3-phosphate ABC transporter ATP-binding protein UgpC [Alphaproteobacteria bacterium]|nr:sn-glycerol-3-phosphate ABC transporter ATP-binding protein UgpC [Alphaproteobacteria bacterium]
MADMKLRSVRKAFGSVEVIHGLSIDIDDGAFVVLVGPSGCGKSTLIRMIAGLEDISSGEVEIGGSVVNKLPPKDRDIAMVFQSYALYPHMTVAENMGFSLKLAGNSKSTIAQKVREAASTLGLGDLLDRYPRQLSGGQRQRVAMGRALVRNPQVFLFDEPLSNLDAKLRVEMRAEIKDLQQRLGTTTVYVTHDQVEAMTMADQIVVLHAGRVEQVGPPLELYDRPVNLFVARFIGSPAMNILEGVARKKDGTLVCEIEGGLSLPLPPANVIEGERVFYGIRPEKLAIADTGLDTEIQLVEPTGAETLVALRLGSQTINALFHHRVTGVRGERMFLRIDPSDVHLFSYETERRILVG